MCFNIIPRSKRYSLFPILGGLIKPSLRNFRISLANGLFSPVGIDWLNPSLRPVLESFLTHTAHPFFRRPYSIPKKWDFSLIYAIFRVNQRGSFHEFKTEIWINNPFYFVLSFFPPSKEKISLIIRIFWKVTISVSYRNFYFIESLKKTFLPKKEKTYYLWDLILHRCSRL